MAIEVEIHLGKGFEDLKNLSKVVNELRQNLNAQTQSIKKGFENMWREIGQTSQRGGRQAGKRASDAYLNELKRVRAAAGSLLSTAGFGSTSAGTFGAALGGAIGGPLGSILGGVAGTIVSVLVDAFKAIGNQVKTAFQAAADVEDTKLAYSLHGGIAAGARQYRDVTTAPLNLKFTQQQLAQAMIPILSAGFSSNAQRNITNSALILAKANKGAGYGVSDVSAIAEQFAKIKLRDGLTRRQLAGLNVANADKFFTDLGKSIGVSAKEAEALARDGKHADRVIHQLNLAIKAMADSVTGGGRGGLKALETLGDVWEKVTSLPLRIYQELANDGSGRYGKLKDSLSRFFGGFFDDVGKPTAGGAEVLTALGNGLSTIIDLLGQKILTPANITAFTAGLAALIQWVNDFVVSFAPIAEKAGHAASVGFGGGTWASNVLKFAKRTREGGLAHATWERIKDFYGFGDKDETPASPAAGAPSPKSITGSLPTDIKSIPDLATRFRLGHMHKNALPWSPEALPSENLGVTSKPPYVNQIVHSPTVNIHGVQGDPDRIRDAVIEGNRQSIKELEAAVQQDGGVLNPY